MGDGLISVIIPVYRVRKYLRRCVDSVLCQTYADLEIILVDDGTDDGCDLICDAYKEQDSRVCVIHKQNGGLSSARNSGLEIASGDYIGFVDSDDYIEPEMYERLIGCMESDVDVVTCDTKHEWGNVYKGASDRRKVSFPPQKMYGKDALKGFLLLRKIETAAWNKLYRRGVFENLRFPTGKVYEDVPVVWEIIKRSRAVVNNGYADYHYFHRSGSITRGEFFTERLLDGDCFAREILADVKRNYPELTEEASLLNARFLLDLMSQLLRSRNRDSFEDIFSEMQQELLCHGEMIRKSKYIDEGLRNALLSCAKDSYSEQKKRSDQNGDAGERMEIFGQNDRRVMSKSVFFGCGGLCHIILGYWKEFGVHPEYLCDNNAELWGTYIAGIPVIAPADIPRDGSERIFITTVHHREVFEQLIAMGFLEQAIRETAYPLEVMNLKTIADMNRFQTKGIERRCEGQVILDLSCGMVLGGVEQWSYKTADLLRDMGRNVFYFVPFMEPMSAHELRHEKILLGNADDRDNKISVFADALNRFSEMRKVTVICNFPFEIFQAAAFAKRCFNPDMKLIAVVHSDEELYYRIYTAWKDEVDIFVAISKRIYRKLVLCGIPESRIKILKWAVDFPCADRMYSREGEPIRIGYAGRITICEKRSDFLSEIMSRLAERKIEFEFEVAGDGDYRKELERRVGDAGIPNVRFRGVLGRDAIYDFWSKRDIYISTSEREGHSLSQLEAMAMGAVPIATDVSGAEDDIADGVNGFIVGVGDIEGIVEKIEMLYRNRQLLKSMGEMAEKSVRQRDGGDEVVFWREALTDV